MSKQVQDAYIVAATRTPIGKSAGGISATPGRDDLLVAARQAALAQVPTLDPNAIEDAIVGCSFPRPAGPEHGPRGHGAGRAAAQRGRGHHQPLLRLGPTTAVAMAADRIRVGEADVMMAGGCREHEHGADDAATRLRSTREVFARDENVGIAYGMGLTAEKVAAQWKVSRERAGRLRAGLAPEGAGGHRLGQFKAETTPGRCSSAARPRHRRHRRPEDPHRGHRRRPARRTPRSRAWRSLQAGVRRQGLR
jgi:acetyl-CoA acyltransferase